MSTIYKFAVLIVSLLVQIAMLGQRPVSQVEGLLEVYDNLDTSSIYIGLNSAPQATALFHFNNLVIGTDAGANISEAANNTFVGRSAGMSTTIGNNNTFYGTKTGYRNTISSENSFFGSFAGYNNTLGRNNSFFGTMTGESNTIGVYNSFFGSRAGRKNTIGSKNSFFGREAGRDNTTGYENTYVGADAGLINTTGYNNVFIGAYAGESNSNGHHNVMLGHEAGLNNQNGYRNNYFGSQAGETLHNGIGNSLFGYMAGHQLNGGQYNIIIGHQAGPSDNATLNQKLFIDVGANDNPLIYGEFDMNLIRINGDLDVTGVLSAALRFDSSSLHLRQLGEDADKGVTWAETNDPVFGLIYDGVGTGAANVLHLREYIGTSENIMTFKANGHIGIGQEDAKAPLHVSGGGDATLTTGGYILLGDIDGLNTVIDDNEIMARDSGQNAPLNLNVDGGDVRLGGKIRIKDDTTPAETGQIRFNTTTDDFEGYDGSNWKSLTNKKEYQIFIGPGSFKANEEDFHQRTSFVFSNGVTRNAESGSFGHKRIVPLQLPVGAIIKQVVYFYREDLPDASLEMTLAKYNLDDSTGQSVGFSYESPLNNAIIGWTSSSVVQNVTIQPNSFYAFQFINDGTGLSNHDDLLQYKGIRVTYTLP